MAKGPSGKVLMWGGTLTVPFDPQRLTVRGDRLYYPSPPAFLRNHDPNDPVHGLSLVRSSLAIELADLL